MRTLIAACLVLFIVAVLTDGPPEDPAAPTPSVAAYTAPPPDQAPVTAPSGTFELDTLDVEGEAPPPPPRPRPTPRPAPEPEPVTDWTHGFPPCVYEDGSGGPIPCYWDASTRGNGVGRSYIVWTED